MDAADLRRFEKDVDMSLVLEAAAAGDVKSLEMHYGPMKRLTAVCSARNLPPAFAGSRVPKNWGFGLETGSPRNKVKHC